MLLFLWPAAGGGGREWRGAADGGYPQHGGYPPPGGMPVKTHPTDVGRRWGPTTRVTPFSMAPSTSRILTQEGNIG